MALSEILNQPIVYGIVGILAAVLWWKWTSKHSKMPPGPRPLPLIGNLMELYYKKDAYKYIAELSQHYGDVITLHFGLQQCVLINSMESAREALVHKQNDFAGRPVIYSGNLFTGNGKDIVFGNFSPVWKLQRKIAHGAIRKFMTGSELERRVRESVDNLTEIWEKQKEPADPLSDLTLMIYNIFANMTFGKKWKRDDKEFQELYKAIEEVTELFGNGLPADYIPFLKYLPASAKAKKITDFVTWFYDYLRKIYKEHKDTYSEGEESDLMYHLIATLKEAEAEGDPAFADITDEHMFQIFNDVFFAGTDTSRFTLHWSLAYLAANPDVQAKVQAEIDDTCGDYPVTMKSKHHLHYTDAVLHEVLRMQPIAPLALPHTTTCDTTIGPYEIPKGTWVMVNLWALHHDPKEWEDPEDFKPQRFLNENGNMAPKPNSYLPFSSGRRVCVGEALAKSELLLILALICQRFSIEVPDGASMVPETQENSLVCMAKPYKVLFKPRTATI